MRCPKCGKEIPNDSIFCEACGARMKKSRKALWITLSIVFVLVAGVVLFYYALSTTNLLQPTYYEEHSYYVDFGLPSGGVPPPLDIIIISQTLRFVNTFFKLF